MTKNTSSSRSRRQQGYTETPTVASEVCPHIYHGGVPYLPRDCDNPECRFRNVQSGGFYCYRCQNSKVVLVPCGCGTGISAQGEVYAHLGEPSGGPPTSGGSGSSSGGGGCGGEQGRKRQNRDGRHRRDGGGGGGGSVGGS